MKKIHNFFKWYVTNVFKWQLNSKTHKAQFEKKFNDILGKKINIKISIIIFFIFLKFLIYIYDILKRSQEYFWK
jgi:hypothetical protein